MKNKGHLDFLKYFPQPIQFAVFYWYFMLFVMKIMLLFTYSKLLTIYDFIFVASFFIPEILLIGFQKLIFYFCKSHFIRKPFGRYIKIFIIAILNILTIIIYSLSIISVYKIGFVMNWSTSLCAAQSTDALKDIGMSELLPAIWLICVLSIFLISGIMIIKFAKSRIKYKLINSENANLQKSNKKPILWLILVLIISLILRSEHSSDPDICLNPMIQLFTDLLDYYDHRCIYAKTELNINKQHLEWLQNCKNFNDIIKQYRSNSQICFESSDNQNSDFSFIKRTGSDPIQNIVIIFLESTRSEMMPFNYSSKFAKTWLREDAIKERKITPFLDKLANKSIYSTISKSTTSFTSKSILAALCSTYPYPQNFGVEYKYNFYNKCLPELLRKYGNYSTLYVQPHVTEFDQYTEMIKKFGFEEYYNAEKIDKGELIVKMNYAKLMHDAYLRKNVSLNDSLSNFANDEQIIKENFENKPEVEIGQFGNFGFDFEVSNEHNSGDELIHDMIRQSHIDNFDNTNSSTNLISKKVIMEGTISSSDKTKLERINMMGYEDEVMHIPIADWLDTQIHSKKPFLLTYATSITHIDFDTPTYWPMRAFSKGSNTIHKYLNALAYVDDFLERIFNEFEERGLDKNTVFILMGDHGVGLGENGAWYTTDIQNENLFNVPFIVYSGNEEFNRKFPNQKIHKSWTTIDILPTILHALNFNKQNAIENYAQNLEGQSILLYEKYTTRLQISLVNPGMSAIILCENNYKIVLPGIGWRKEEIYDLSSDLYEENPIQIKLANSQLKTWVHDMKNLRSLYIIMVKQWYTQK